MEKGTRVWAVLGKEGDMLYTFGEGVYVGNEIPEQKDIDEYGTKRSWLAMLKEINRANPKILLNTGKNVYGCECWWTSSEQRIKDMYEQFPNKVKEIDVSEYRQRDREEK